MTLLKTSNNQTFYSWADGIFGLKMAHQSPQVNPTGLGGYLPGYDVKNRDAYQMVQLSLATHLGDNPSAMYECYSNGTGEIDFYSIGLQDSLIRGDDILYQIDGIEMKQQCDSVMVIGYDPPFKRFNRGPYNLFTFSRDYVVDQGDDSVNNNQSSNYDPYWDQYPFYYVLGKELGNEACEYFKEAYIEYGNPHLNDEKKLSSNGAPIAAGAEAGSPVYDHKSFEKIIGWMYVVNMGDIFEQGSTEVQLQQKSPRYVTLKDFGNLQQRQWEPSGVYQPQVCRDLNQEDVVLSDVGIHLPDSDLPKFLGVREVYIYGYELKEIAVDEYRDEDGDLTGGPTDFIVSLDTMMAAPIKLSQGEDYIVVKDTDAEGEWGTGRHPYKIIFSCNVSPNYIGKFGGDIGTSADAGQASFRVSKTSIYGEYDPEKGQFAIPICEDQDFFGTPDSETVCKGFLKDGVTPIESDDIFYASIFPMGEGNSGYAMPGSFTGPDDTDRSGSIIVVYDWDNPCLRVLDQKNQATLDKLEAISINLYAIIGKDLEPPIALTNTIKGTLMLDPRDKIPDFDESTVDLLSNNTYQQAMEGLENGDIKITLPFISCAGNPWEECGQLMGISKFIYNMQREKVKTTTYICDPNTTPVLGQTIGTGNDLKVINSIDYSYQDSSQYLISIQAGPRWQGSGGWDQSVYQNKVERLQLEGVVRSLYSDGRCLIDIERMGLLECVNGQVEPLEIGDTVRVTMFNNPISI